MYFSNSNGVIQAVGKRGSNYMDVLPTIGGTLSIKATLVSQYPFAVFVYEDVDGISKEVSMKKLQEDGKVVGNDYVFKLFEETE